MSILPYQANLLHHACNSPHHIRLHRDAALRQAQALLEANLISSIPVAATGAPSSSEKPLEDNAASSYFIVSEAPDPEPGQALNSHFSWYGPARPALQVRYDYSTPTCWRPCYSEWEPSRQFSLCISSAAFIGPLLLSLWLCCAHQ